MSVSIGIDPGKVTGFAVCGEDGKLISLQSTDFWGAYLTVNAMHDLYGVEQIVIEVPQTKANWHGNGAAHNVGRVCREAELLAEGLARQGYKVVEQHPSGKVNHKEFCLITNWCKGKTNQHCRDAAMLVYGRKL